MLAECNAECSPDDPLLVVPWTDPATGARFIDLRAEPYDLAEVREAEQQPALGRALRSLNGTRSPVMTAKCDTWWLTPEHRPEELHSLRLELNLEPELAACGFGSYIDLLWRDRSLFVSAHQQQAQQDRLTRRLARLPHDTAFCSCVLRPALLAFESRGGPLEGFSTTLYVTALGPDRVAAASAWEAALADVVDTLRSREFEVARGSATID